MRRPLSIRLRFALVSLVSVPLALALTATFLISLFSADLERRTEAELSRHIGALAAAIRIRPDGGVDRPEALPDRRFSEPYSGLYWQIEDAGGLRLRSPSLWDVALELPPAPPEDGATHRYTLAGPDRAELIVQERRIFIASPAGSHGLRVAVAADRKPIDAASRAFALDTIPYVAGVAVFLVAAALVQMTFGLRPLSALARELDRIREKRGGRLESGLPVEFQPVEEAVNRLLDTQAEAIARARGRAGDLAHGLKTPLTVLMNNALTLRERGETEIADEIEHLARQMQVHAERELLRSRIAASAGLRQSNGNPAAIAGAVVRTLKRTARGEALEFRVEVPEALTLPIDAHDLRELLGNLLENAVKWAESRVCLTWRGAAAGGALVIEDDGPGIDPDRISSMTVRGVRYDEKMPGFGLGLGIVHEICEVYGLGLTIGNRQTHGLRVAVAFDLSRA